MDKDNNNNKYRLKLMSKMQSDQKILQYQKPLKYYKNKISKSKIKFKES